MEGRKQKKFDAGTAFIWGGTFVLAVAIIGISVFMAMGRKGVSVTPPAVPSAPVAAPFVPEQMDEPVVVEKKAEETLPEAPVRPAIRGGTGPVELDLSHLAGTLKLSLPFLNSRDKLPLEHTCFRQNISPAMNWSGAPSGTESFVVFMEKKAGEDGRPFLTWAVFGIPGDAAGLPANMPKTPALEGGMKHAASDHNNIGYIGPCESKGRVTYAIRVFALDTVIVLPPYAGKYALIRAMNGHIIDAAEQDFVHYYKL